MKVPSKFYFLTSPGAGGIPVGQLTPERLSNPNIAGYRWRQGHRTIQTLENVFDWSPIDEALELCVTSGQLFGLSVSWGNDAASWVYDTVEEFPFDPANETGSMPNIFDPLYLPILQDFIQQMGALYNPHPNVSYVVVSGCMQHFEGYLGKTEDEETRLNAAAIAAGFDDLADGWLTISQQVISSYVTAFPDTAVLFTSAKPFPSDAGGTQQSILREWIVDTHSPHAGWMTAQLHAVPGPWPPPTDKTYPFGFQAIFSGNDVDRMYNEVPVPEPVPPQIMIDFIENGYSKAAQFLEIYRFDMDLAINQSTFADLAPKFHSFIEYIPPEGSVPQTSLPPPLSTPTSVPQTSLPGQPPVVIGREVVARIIPCKTGTHARNIILAHKRLGPPVIIPNAPGAVEILDVVTPHEPSSGRATATWLSPVGSDAANLSYIAFLTGGSGTITIVSEEPFEEP